MKYLEIIRILCSVLVNMSNGMFTIKHTLLKFFSKFKANGQGSSIWWLLAQII